MTVRIGKSSTPEDELRKVLQAELLQYKAELANGFNQAASGRTATELSIDRLERVFRQYAAKETAKALENGVSVIYGIANDLANQDPKVVGAVSTAPYFANSVAIYSEFLKGDNFERIDWRELKLPALERIKQLKERS